jgi:hypothetical protein
LEEAFSLSRPSSRRHFKSSLKEEEIEDEATELSSSSTTIMLMQKDGIPDEVFALIAGVPSTKQHGSSHGRR